MTFVSLEYIAFLATVTAIFWVLPVRFRPTVLAVSSVLFLATWSPWFALFAVATTLTVFFLAKAPSGSWVVRTMPVVLAVVLLVGFKIVLSLGAGPASIGLPTIGLSFFLFHCIAYSVDVRKGRIRPETNPVNLASYILFFPHLLAGPILRYRRFRRELRSVPRRPNLDVMARGVQLLIRGAFKKLVLADGASSELARIELTGGYRSLLGLICGLLAMYFDVTGYIDMARGSAYLMGIRMPVNFLQPITKSRSVPDFWGRYQITLIGFFKEYLYGPIRGSNHSPARRIIAVAAVMVVASLWHAITVPWLLWALLFVAGFAADGAAVRWIGPDSSLLAKARRGILFAVFLGATALIIGPLAPSLGQASAGASQLVSWPALIALVALLVAVVGFEHWDGVELARRSSVGVIRWPEAFFTGWMFVTLLIFAGGAGVVFTYQRF